MKLCLTCKKTISRNATFCRSCRPVSQKTKEKLSAIAKEKGYGKWMKDRQMPQETRTKISEHHKKNGVGRWMENRIMPEETRSKIRKWSIENEIHKRLPIRSDEDNPMWKGLEVGYEALHAWVNRKLGKPIDCENCGENSNNKTYDRASISREYKRELNDWISLCRSCHRIYDLNELTLEELKNRIQCQLQLN